MELSWVWVCVVSGCVPGRLALAPANSVFDQCSLDRHYGTSSQAGQWHGLGATATAAGTYWNRAESKWQTFLRHSFHNAMYVVHANMCASAPGSALRLDSRMHLVAAPLIGVGWAESRRQELYLYLLHECSAMGCDANIFVHDVTSVQPAIYIAYIIFVVPFHGVLHPLKSNRLNQVILPRIRRALPALYITVIFSWGAFDRTNDYIAF